MTTVWVHIGQVLFKSIKSSSHFVFGIGGTRPKDLLEKTYKTPRSSLATTLCCLVTFKLARKSRDILDYTMNFTISNQGFIMQSTIIMGNLYSNQNPAI